MMPATYSTFTAGPVQFFALDTDIISEAQRLWLTAELDRSPATWKVVYGHHPIYSEGQHEDNNVNIEQLLPVLEDRADVYLAEHDHDMQHLKPDRVSLQPRMVRSFRCHSRNDESSSNGCRSRSPMRRWRSSNARHGKLRHPRLLAVRLDKDARDVVREQP